MRSTISLLLFTSLLLLFIFTASSAYPISLQLPFDVGQYWGVRTYNNHNVWGAYDNKLRAIDWFYVNTHQDTCSYWTSSTTASQGKNLRAAHSGTIYRVRILEAGYGNSIVIKSSEDPTWFTLYAHLDTIKSGIAEGVSVNVGDIIGTVGASGSGSGGFAHLHFEVEHGNSSNDWVPQDISQLVIDGQTVDFNNWTCGAPGWLSGYIGKALQSRGSLQTPVGTIAGVVTDTSNAPISGATVSTNTGGYSVTTNSSGNYTLPAVNIGTYNVTASRFGYAALTNNNVMVTANNTATSNFSLTAADTTPPTITNIVPSPTWVIPDGTVTVTANVTDDKAISQGNINLLGANLLTNPSFESGMPGWINNSSPSYSVLSTGGYPSPGTAKVGGRWAASSSMNGGAPEISQVVNVTPGAKYFLSVWAYTDGSPNTCSSYLQWKDGAATAVNVDWFDNNTPSGGWKQLCGTVTPTSSQLTYILKLSWASNGGGNFDLAEVRLAPNPDTYANGIATWNNVIVPTSYAFQVYAKDDAGNESQVVSSTTVNIDSTVPDTPIVTDDGVYTADTSQLNANWTSSDSESGIAEYQYAIGNATGGTSIVDWTSIGTANTVTKTGLSLARDQIYYFSVKAKNGAGQWSSVGMSDGIVVASPVDSISEAKSYQDSSVVQLTNKPVSASTASTLWLEESNRSSGIRVNYSSAIQPGTSVTITGRMATSQSERFIDQAVVQQNGAVSIPKALALSNKQLGGSTLNLYTPGVKNGIGLNNIGLLVQVWGRVTQLGSGYFYIDDGSGLLDGSTTGILQNNGIRVLAAPDTSLPGDIVIVTGISTTFDLSDQHIRAVTPIIDGIKKIN